MSKLDDLWKENNFPGANRFLELLKHKGIKATKSQVDAYIDAQKTAQLHRRPARHVNTPITTTNPGVIYQADLLDVTPFAHDNMGAKWLLVCIDVFTRRASVVSMKNKTAATCLEALKEAFDDLGEPPLVLHTDLGSEFKGAVEAYLKKHNIRHRQNEVHDHKTLGIVDRFCGIVKLWIAKYQTHSQSQKYIHALDGFVKKYNNSPHSNLGEFTPNEALRYPRDIRNVFYGRVQDAMNKKRGKSKVLAVGDYVRILKIKGVFDKGYHVKYSLGVHRIVSINGLNYTLDNGKFYRVDRLRKVPKPDEEAVVDVARAGRKAHRTEVLLKTDGIVQSNRRSGLRERAPASYVEDAKFGRVKWS
jgi:transposase InsO family protein